MADGTNLRYRIGTSPLKTTTWDKIAERFDDEPGPYVIDHRVTGQGALEIAVAKTRQVAVPAFRPNEKVWEDEVKLMWVSVRAVLPPGSWRSLVYDED
jgi:hypothetical protein